MSPAVFSYSLKEKPMFRTTHGATRSLLFTLAATGTLLSAGPTIAAPIPETTEVHVAYADLDLTSTASVDTLYRRIVSASRQVCPAMPPGRVKLAVTSAIRECRAAAVERAVAQIANPQLAAVHAVAQRRS